LQVLHIFEEQQESFANFSGFFNSKQITQRDLKCFKSLRSSLLDNDFSHLSHFRFLHKDLAQLRQVAQPQERSRQVEVIDEHLLHRP
jgi:hypothetical protein